MPVGISNGDFHEDDFSHSASDFIAPEPETSPTEGLKKVYITRSSDTPEPEPTSLPTADSIVSPGDDIHPTPDYLNPPESTMSFRPSATGIVSGLFKSAISAATLPGDVASGEVDPSSEEAIGRSAELAGWMVGAPAPVASKLADGSLGSFMGVKSSTFDRGLLSKAQELEQKGIHPDDIWTDTQTHRGADARWRQEIPDKGSTLKHENMDVTANTVGIKPHKGYSPPKADATLEDLTAAFLGRKQKPTILRDVLDHPELFKAYPELETIKLHNLKDYGGPGMTSTVEGVHTADGIFMKDASPAKFRQILMHEVQHAIQKIEGFASGGNPGQFAPEALGPAMKDFEKVKTEALNQIKEATGLSHFEMGAAIGALKTGLEKTGKAEVAQAPLDFFMKPLEKIKEAGMLNKIENIAKSEHIIKQAQNEWFEKYQRLMGEVESRNVEKRLDMIRLERKYQSPQNTEDRPRFAQINSDQKTQSNAEITKPTSPRWPNNDNARPLNEHEQFIKDYDELKALGDSLGTKKSSKYFGDYKKWSELDTAKYNKAGREFAKKHGHEWTDVPFEPLNR